MHAVLMVLLVCQVNMLGVNRFPRLLFFFCPCFFTHHIRVIFFFLIFFTIFTLVLGTRELTFSWWGCYGLCLRHKPTELADSLYSVLVSVSVFMALSIAFPSTNYPDNSPVSLSVLPVLFLPYWSFQLYTSLRKSPSALI